MEKQMFRLVHESARKNAARACLSAPEGFLVSISEPTRNLNQNAMLWALLADLAEQTMWHGIKLTSDEWKDLLSAGLVKSKVVPNIEGSGFVILGQRTSKMSKREFADLITLIQAFGDERGVKWSDQPVETPARFAA